MDIHRLYDCVFLIRYAKALAVLAFAVILVAAGQARAAEQPEPIDKRIDRLIELLGDQRYSVRQRAQNELAELGFAAFEALAAATEHEDLEIASRANYLLRLIRIEWTQEDDPPDVKQLLESYEFEPPEERQRRMHKLARLPDGKGLAALVRLVRFEGSDLLSKYAAARILDHEPLAQAARDRWAGALKEHLGRSSRTAAAWLLGYLKLGDQREAALPAWTALVEAEEVVLKRTPTESSPAILTTLLYRLAEQQANGGQKELADATAERARGINPVRTDEQLYAYLETVQVLRQRGLFTWAEAEYRRIIDNGLAPLEAIARTGLAEMRHDQGNHLAAAETLRELLEPLDSATLQSLQIVGRTPAEIRGRMNYFFACHWVEKGDRTKQRHYLDEAVAADPGEIDSLIARYRLPEVSDDYRRQTLELIDQAVAGMRQQIEEDPRDATNYNQFAWLVGNTERDLDEALTCALKAIELAPDSSAYYDTAAHVYFAKSDYENAVKYQTKAAELDPHSGLISKKLKVFRTTLKESRNDR